MKYSVLENHKTSLKYSINGLSTQMHEKIHILVLFFRAKEKKNIKNKSK